MIRIRFCSFLVWLSVLPISLSAQSAVQWNASQIKLHLEKLNVLGSVLYLAAHPDDENSRLLAYFSNGALYRTAYLSLNRGDGGQNLIGDEQGSLLGLIRTQELLAARRIDGAEQFFTRANDFGFSKTAVETLKFWGRERILGDIVWVIRKFRPDVIICRFPADKRAGHGNHWASAILAKEAFTAAADPSMFPAQLKYVKTWQAKRLLWNTFHFGRFNTTSPDQFHMNAGGFNTLLGKSYGEIAGDSRSMHKTQGAGMARQRGSEEEYFATILGPAPVKNLMDGVNTSWDRVENGAGVENLVSDAISHFDMDHPAASLPALMAIYRAIGQVGDHYWKNQKQKETLALIRSCAGLWLDATTSEGTVTSGDPLPIHLQVLNRSPYPMQLVKISFPGSDTILNQVLGDDTPFNFDNTIRVSSTLPISQPYWLLKPHPIGYYHVADQQKVGRPEDPPAITVHFQIRVGDQNLSFTRPVQYRYTDPVRGGVNEPLAITPPVTANLEHSTYIFTSGDTQQVLVNLEAFTDHADGTVSLSLPPGYQSVEKDLPFRLVKKGDETSLRFGVLPLGPLEHSESGTLTALIHFHGKTFDRGIKVIAYTHIPTITVFPPAQTKLVRLNLKIAGKHIGYIAGAGDMVPDALKQTGYQVTLLSNSAIARGGLSRFDAIITGIRAYNVDPDLRYLQDTLLAYVQQGGTLVLQYNKPFDLATRHLGPYPFRVSNDRVTDETAEVGFLQPGNPVMNWPNQITESDFNGWIQERGLYFTADQDSHYQKLFSMHDPGEASLDGSTLVTTYGKGKYVYTSLDFFRDLPAGVPGAFRVFANLIARKGK